MLGKRLPGNDLQGHYLGLEMPPLGQPWGVGKEGIGKELGAATDRNPVNHASRGLVPEI